MRVQPALLYRLVGWGLLLACSCKSYNTVHIPHTPHPVCAGIIPEEVVEPMPRVLQALVRRLVRWGVLPAAKAPDSAIINIYEPEDCIPPHIDHHDFTRPFCTLRWAAAQSVPGLGSGLDLLLPAAKTPAAPSSVSMSRRAASRRTSTTTTSRTPSARSGARPGTRGP